MSNGAFCLLGVYEQLYRFQERCDAVLADEKILLTVKEFARVSGLGETCIRNLVQTEGFPVLRNGRKYMIHRRAADKWLEEQACHAGSAG